MVNEGINYGSYPPSSLRLIEALKNSVNECFVKTSEKIGDILFLYELKFLNNNRDKKLIEAYLAMNEALAEGIEELLSLYYRRLIKDFEELVKQKPSSVFVAPTSSPNSF